MSLTPATGLVAATTLHLGFQAVVTAVVYPALAEVPDDRWTSAHAAHSRRITAVVGPVYALLGAACVRTLASGSRTAVPGLPALSVLPVLAVTASAAAVLSTALVAAPTHRRLAHDGAAPQLLARLRRADAVRLAGAGVAALAALAASRTDG